MFGINKKPATDEAPPKVKTRGEQLRDGDRELIAREGCRLSNDYFLLEFVKPAGGSRGRYEIIGVRSDSLTVVAEHESADFGDSGKLYGAGNEDLWPYGYVHKYKHDGQRDALRRITRGLAAAADLATAAERAARNVLWFGDGNASSAENRIKLIEDFCWPMLKNLESLEVEMGRLGYARFEARRQRDARPSPEAERAAAEAKRLEAIKALNEQAKADAASAQAYHAEMKTLRENANREFMEAEARRSAAEAAERAERDAWRAEQERLRAEAAEEERRLIAEAEEAARS